MHLAGGPKTLFHAAPEMWGREMWGCNCLGDQISAEVFADLRE